MSRPKQRRGVARNWDDTIGLEDFGRPKRRAPRRKRFHDLWEEERQLRPPDPRIAVDDVDWNDDDDDEWSSDDFDDARD